MLDKLREIVRGIFHTTNKKDMLKTLDKYKLSVDNDVIEVLAYQVSFMTTNKIELDKKTLSLFRQAGFKFKDSVDLAKSLLDFYDMISKELPLVKKELDKTLPDYIMESNITAKQAAIIKFISDIGYLITFAMDVALLMTTSPDKYTTKALDVLYKKIIVYIRIKSFYEEGLVSTLSDIEKISTEEINTDVSLKTDSSFVSALLGNTGKVVNLPPNGFSNNPIYHFRMWAVDRDMNKLELLKDKKKMVELRLLELKLAQEKTADPALTKQIEYYEEKLGSLEYDINKIKE